MPKIRNTHPPNEYEIVLQHLRAAKNKNRNVRAYGRKILAIYDKLAGKLDSLGNLSDAFHFLNCLFPLRFSSYFNNNIHYFIEMKQWMQGALDEYSAFQEKNIKNVNLPDVTMLRSTEQVLDIFVFYDILSRSDKKGNKDIPIHSTMLSILISVFAVFLAIVSGFLILLILVQRGRGGGLVGAFGGMGGQSAFGARAGDVFTKVTIVTVTVWILLCIGLLLAMKRVGSMSSNEFGEGNVPATSAPASTGTPNSNAPVTAPVPTATTPTDTGSSPDSP